MTLAGLATRIVCLCLLAVAAFTPGVASAPWCVGTTGDGPPLIRADYSVDLLGNVAVGSLTLEFGAVEEGVATRFRDFPPAGLTTESLHAGIDGGAEYELEVSVRKQQAAQGARKAASRQAAPSTAGRISEEFLLAPGETLRVRASFRKRLDFSGDRFRLELADVTDSCATAPDRTDSTRTQASALTSTTVVVHHEQPLVVAESPSHGIDVVYEGTRTVVSVSPDDTQPSRPFEFGYALGGEESPVLIGFSAPEQDGTREVFVVLSPPTTVPADIVRPKEVLFVLDTSGSMNGVKIVEGRAALNACMEKLGDDDYFNVIEFDERFTALNPEPVEATMAARTEAESWLELQEAKGGTALVPALAAAFEQERRPEMHRLVIVLTDGKVTDEDKVAEFLEDKLDHARLFFVGIGRDVNPEVIRRLAEYGRGTFALASDAATLEATVTDLFAEVSAPVAWDLQLDWGGAELVSLEPERAPDLYAGRPVILRARVRGDLPRDLVVESETMRGPQTFRATLRDAPELAKP